MEEEDFEGESQGGLLKWDNMLPTFCLGVNNKILDAAAYPEHC